MKHLVFLFLCLGIFLYATGSVSELKVEPHFPWNGTVDITFSLESDTADEEYLVSFQGDNRDTDEVIPMLSLTGDGANGALLKAGGPYHTVWDAAADWPKAHSLEFIVRATVIPPYLVVNLKTGTSRTSFTGPDLSDDTCRTTELWLRRIPAGTFIMGSPTDEVGRRNNETQHQVTLTEDFYIGVFEMTQKQYELIYGSNPSYLKVDTHPVEEVTYNTIRGSSMGAGWPSSHDVDSDSFLGKLRTRTGLSFDLPTEAQWEYACRAGTTTALNTGKNLTSTGQDSAMDEAGRYEYNQSDGKGGCSWHTKVGSYLPNNWGLYDMHGNVDEWCLDWYQNYLGSAAVMDPVGATSGSYRVVRGGNWDDYAQYCRSACRDCSLPSCSYYTYRYFGFRVVLLP